MSTALRGRAASPQRFGGGLVGSTCLLPLTYHTRAYQVGLCSHLREAVWLGDVDVNTFFPRCYQLNSEEDKECFIGALRWPDSRPGWVDTGRYCVLLISLHAPCRGLQTDSRTEHPEGSD